MHESVLVRRIRCLRLPPPIFGREPQSVREMCTINTLVHCSIHLLVHLQRKKWIDVRLLTTGSRRMCASHIYVITRINTHTHTYRDRIHTYTSLVHVKTSSFMVSLSTFCFMLALAWILPIARLSTENSPTRIPFHPLPTALSSRPDPDSTSCVAHAAPIQSPNWSRKPSTIDHDDFLRWFPPRSPMIPASSRSDNNTRVAIVRPTFSLLVYVWKFFCEKKLIPLKMFIVTWQLAKQSHA